MCRTSRRILEDADATTRLGEDLARIVGAGDTLCLAGDLGAGKSHLARTIVQSLQIARDGTAEEVPSPTYTLVQTYAAGPLEIVHADLYRLGDASELHELGLSDAMGTALCLVEWPDRLQGTAPRDALNIVLGPAGTGRVATLSGRGWDARLAPILDAADA